MADVRGQNSRRNSSVNGKNGSNNGKYGNGNGNNEQVKEVDENSQPKIVINYEQGLERWAGRVAVVTGASSPIGKAVCEELVRHGLICCGLATRAGKHELEVRKIWVSNSCIIFKKCPILGNEQKIRERKLERKTFSL